MNILHVCAGWEESNGAANIARMVAGEQEASGNSVAYRTWARIKELRAVDEVWIHCAWKPCLWWAALWARRYRWMPEASYDPVRLAFHGWKKRLAGPIERFFLRRADRVVATCEAEKEWVKAYLGKRCPMIEVTDIKRFFDLSRAEHAERLESARATERSLHLLYLGRRHPLKGLDHLEAAISEIVSGRRRTAVEGPVPPVELRIVDNAFGEEKERVWEWCDVLVLPTQSENFGLVVAEALERGKRVIATDGAPAWGEGNDYGGRLIYLRGYRDGTRDERVALLKNAIKDLIWTSRNA